MTGDRFQLQHQLVETRKVTRADGKEESRGKRRRRDRDAELVS